MTAQMEYPDTNWPYPMSDLHESLLSVGETKLGIQAATSIGYDTQALGLMAIAVALAGVNVALIGDFGVLWWLPLVALAPSLAISVVTISQPEIETGQNLTLATAMDNTAEAGRRLLLESVTEAIDVNTVSLASKRAMVSLATAMIGFAFALLGIARLLPVTYELITNTFA